MSDNGYGKIDTVEKVVAFLNSDISRLLREANINKLDGFYVKEDHCRMMAEHNQKLVNSIVSRSTL